MFGTLLRLGSKIRTWIFTKLIAGEFKSMGKGSRVVPPFRFHGLDGVVVGEGVIVNRDCWIQTLADRDKEPVKLVIGAHAGIGMGAHISAVERILIGEHVLLGRNVFISDHGHSYQDVTRPISTQGVDMIAPVVIGDETWLGENCVILPGVTIGRHCVIGANSVVRSSIPDYSVAVGAPARVVKSYNRTTKAWEKVVN